MREKAELRDMSRYFEGRVYGALDDYQSFEKDPDPAADRRVPSPRTVVPLLTTSTRFPLAVCWVRQGLVGTVDSLPAGEEEWYSRASSGRILIPISFDYMHIIVVCL